LHGEVYPIQDYVIKFVSDLRQVGVFFPGTLVSTTNKTDRHDVTEIFLKVALNTINQPANQMFAFTESFDKFNYHTITATTAPRSDILG
jgi:hypothetical protein